MNRFFYNGFWNFFVIFLAVSCTENTTNNRSSDEVKFVNAQSRSDSITYNIFPGINNTYGFNIIVNEKVFIHQPFIPTWNGFQYFVNEGDAKTVAKLMVGRLRSKNFRFLLQKIEIDSLLRGEKKEKNILNLPVHFLRRI